MRKHIKSQLIELLNTIKEAHHELSLLCFERAKEAEAAEVLTMCQQAAISVGTSIEESEGEGTHAVTLLENYCELLYETHVKLQENPSGDGEISNSDIEEIISVLNSKIEEVVENIRNDIKERKEVVFMPYQSSMWDSLESVWMEYDADDNYDAYVVPIPYYSKNSDGSFGELHYDIDKYPQNVPVISYDEYNFTVRRPDEIYIHNPYDGCNKVTSVHPDYYASNLKKYTDVLIYIPYFVCMNDAVADHFCVLPGTIHAHKVMVQSEKVKEKYIKVFTEELTEQGIDVKAVFGDLNNKFVVRQSPKIDKVLRTTRENVEVPEKWQKIIGLKKVIFYNTTLQTFMDNSDTYIDKLKAVFKLFAERNDIVLLWRPHPLFEKTVKAMYPYKCEEYRALVKEYIDEEWGLYDDTEDLHRAIAISDAYYGDYSSVVELYKATGKPIMIQNVKLINGRE